MGDHKKTELLFSLVSFGIDPFQGSDYSSLTVRLPLLLPQLALAILLCGSLISAPIVVDDFEYVVLSNDWDNPVVNTDLESGVGAQGSPKFARIKPATGILGAIFEGGASDFFVDFFLRIHPGERQFNFMVMTGEEVVYEGATINLRHQGGTWWAYSGGWQELSLPGLAVDVWYHLRITCKGWGASGASYDLELSDAGGTEFTSSVMDLGLFEDGDPSATTAGSFSFSAHWGNSPGFDLDNVTVETIEPVVGGPPLAITNLEYDPAALTSAITWNAVPGTRYFVYASSDLVNWEEIGIRTASGSEETLMEEEVSAGFRSYRVQDYPEP